MQEHAVREANRASVLLAKIGRGTCDADFARHVNEVATAVEQTGKKGTVTLKLELIPQKSDQGGILFRHGVKSKAPELPPPATTMHRAEDGSLLDQMEFIMGGGRNEAPRVQPQAAAPVAAKPEPVPLAERPQAAPLADRKPAAPLVDRKQQASGDNDE